MDILTVRKQMNDLMNHDQTFVNAVSRKNWQQSRVIPYLKANLKAILADTEENGEYLPSKKMASSPFAFWLLVQHMDMFPQEQAKFFSEFAKKFPKHSKLKFLQDRVAVNKKIVELAKKNNYYDKNGKKLRNPTADVRDPTKFLDADIKKFKPTSASQALQNAKKCGNTLLVQAVEAARPKVTTQPSFFGIAKK